MATKVENAPELLAVVEALRESKVVLVTAHRGPDGDAIGSMAAALLALEQLGKVVLAYNPDPVPRRFRFLAGTDRFLEQLPERAWDTTLILDCSDLHMFPDDLAPERLGKVVVVDHHKTAAKTGDVVLRDPEAASVGVMVYRVMQALGLILRPDLAEAIYCSLMSDTGSFRYKNTNAEAMTVASDMLACGVDTWRVSANLYEERPLRELLLLQRVLQTLVVSADGLCASLTVTGEMLAETGCTPDMVDGFINYGRSIEGVQVALLLRPRSGGVRVSFRSKGAIDVSAIAERFGGGGHHNAAGCMIEGEDPEQTRDQIFAEVTRLTADAQG